MAKLARKYFAIGFTNMFATNDNAVRIAQEKGALTKRFATKRREQIREDKIDSEIRSLYAQARY